MRDQKKYDLEERTAKLGEKVIEFAKSIPQVCHLVILAPLDSKHDKNHNFPRVGRC